MKESTIKVVRDERGRFVKKTGERFFKRGTRVIVTQSVSSFYSKGDKGTVIQSGNPDEGISVQFDAPCTRGNGCWVAGSAPGNRLEILDESKTSATPRPFKVGDVVRMSRKGKREYDNWRKNPHNAIGSITGEGNMPGWFGVKWNNGEWNDYQPHEIELVPNAPKQRKAEKKAQAIEVPEEIPAALQTLAKAFGYKVEKA